MIYVLLAALVTKFGMSFYCPHHVFSLLDLQCVEHAEVPTLEDVVANSTVALQRSIHHINASTATALLHGGNRTFGIPLAHAHAAVAGTVASLASAANQRIVWSFDEGGP